MMDFHAGNSNRKIRCEKVQKYRAKTAETVVKGYTTEKNAV